MLLSVSSTVGIVIDVLIIAVIALLALIGLRKGFFKSVLALFSTLVVLIISIFCAGPFANLINKIYDFTGLIADKICDGMSSMGAFYVEEIPAGISGKQIVQSIPSGTNGFLKKLMAYVLNPLSAGDIEGATVAEIVSGAFASIIMLIISAILLFIIIKIILSIVARLFENITRNRVFGATNKLLGFAFGAVKGLMIILVFTIVLTLLTVVPKINSKVTPMLQDHTKIAKPIYNYTDEMMEKFVVDGKIVQKWIDKLWENKYKDRGDDTTTPEIPQQDGTLEYPYQLSLEEYAGVYTAVITIIFENDEQYYVLNTEHIATENFTLNIEDTADFAVINAKDLNTEIMDLSNLSKNETYLIKFAKTGLDNMVEVNVVAIPIN